MTVVRLYRCDKCNNNYDTKSEAENCEQSHMTPYRVERNNDDNMTDIHGYPVDVTVTFGLERKLVYRMTDISIKKILDECW